MTLGNFPTVPNQQGAVPTFVYSGTPEGLVSVGDIPQMQRYLMLSNSHLTDPSEAVEAGDAARQALFAAGNNGLVKTKDGRIMRLRLYSWPVCLSFRSTAVVSSDYLMSGGDKDKTLLLKMRELWARAFCAAEGLLISPLAYAPHLNELLGASPLTIRDCVRNGVNLFSGKVATSPWRFVSERGRIECGADMPAVFVFCAYVAWELGEKEPMLQMGRQLQHDMEQVVAAMFTGRQDAKVKACAGPPSQFQDAVTDGQVLFVRQLFARGVETSRELSVTFEIQGLMLRMSAMFLQGDDVESEIEYCYSDMWRPRSHVQAIQAGLLAKANEISAMEEASSARQGHAGFGFNAREIH